MPAFQVMASGCGGVVHRDQQGPTRCLEEPTVAGLWFAGPSRTAWLGFACDRHAGDLIAARTLLPRDRDILSRRRDQRRTETAGRRWAGEQEGPVARGVAAEQLVERARAWEARQARSPRGEQDHPPPAGQDR